MLTLRAAIFEQTELRFIGGWGVGPTGISFRVAPCERACVRACARCGFLAAFDRKRGRQSFPFLFWSQGAYSLVRDGTWVGGGGRASRNVRTSLQATSSTNLEQAPVCLHCILCKTYREVYRFCVVVVNFPHVWFVKDFTQSLGSLTLTMSRKA